MMTTATSTKPACEVCGAVLSVYRDPDDVPGLCRPCARAEREREEAEHPSRMLSAEQLTDAVAGLLLLGRALSPDEPVLLRAELALRGVDVQAHELQAAISKLKRRHGLTIEAEEREPGYRLAEPWPYRFTRQRRASGD